MTTKFTGKLEIIVTLNVKHNYREDFMKFWWFSNIFFFRTVISHFSIICHSHTIFQWVAELTLITVAGWAIPSLQFLFQSHQPSCLTNHWILPYFLLPSICPEVSQLCCHWSPSCWLFLPTGLLFTVPVRNGRGHKTGEMMEEVKEVPLNSSKFLWC